MELTFTNPHYLWILLALPIFIITHIFTLKYSRSVALKIANFEAIERISKGYFLATPHRGFQLNKTPLLLILRMLTYALLILSISGATIWYMGESSSYDFVLAIDTSSSMLADDFSPNRLEAAKQSARLFVDTVPDHSEIGIITFAGVPSTELKMSSEKEEIINALNHITLSETGGTNLGDAIVSSVNLLESSDDDKESDVIILMTDGQSNVGTPVDQAITYANENNVMVHTMGIGTEEGGSFLPDVISKIDENSLKSIAESTQGRYYKVSSIENLDDSFREIASVTIRRLSFELSWILLISGLILLSLEWLLINTRYRTIP